MFTVIDDLLQVRAWQVDLHGALMDGRQQLPWRQKINLKICRMLQNIFCRNIRGVKFVFNGLQNIRTPVLSCTSCCVIPIGRVRLACIANYRWHERLRRRCRRRRRRAYCVSALSAWGPHQFSVTHSSQSISFPLSNGANYREQWLQLHEVRVESACDISALQYNHIAPQ